MSNVDEKLSELLERAKNYGLRPERDSVTMPAARTHELPAACEEKQIRAAAVGADNFNEPGLF
jgi:hypothetical protein